MIESRVPMCAGRARREKREKARIFLLYAKKRATWTVLTSALLTFRRLEELYGLLGDRIYLVARIDVIYVTFYNEIYSLAVPSFPWEEITPSNFWILTSMRIILIPLIISEKLLPF